jgi:hypothetical protein
MKYLSLYTISLIIVALMATSCEKQAYRSNWQQDETSSQDTYDFQEADLDDGPPCGCEYREYNYPQLRLVYNSNR